MREFCSKCSSTIIYCWQGYYYNKIPGSIVSSTRSTIVARLPWSPCMHSKIYYGFARLICWYHNDHRIEVVLFTVYITCKYDPASSSMKGAAKVLVKDEVSKHQQQELTKDNYSKWYNQNHSVISLKKSGYSTFWALVFHLSNQFQSQTNSPQTIVFSSKCPFPQPSVPRLCLPMSIR